MRHVARIAAVAATVLVSLQYPAQAQETGALPEGVTQNMIRQGEGTFKGAGLCSACHGPQGRGIPNLGANLTDSTWLHSDGSYAGVLQTIRQGVGADKSSNGTTMPPKGGSALSEDQLKAVAAYVWSLSHHGS